MTCPQQRWRDRAAADAALLDRRIAASLSGSPLTASWRSYSCNQCSGAHITKQEPPQGRPGRRAQQRQAS